MTQVKRLGEQTSNDKEKREYEEKWGVKESENSPVNHKPMAVIILK